MIKLARSLGHSAGTLHSARKRLGVKTEKVSYRGGWEWFLPKIQSSLEPSEPESSQEAFSHAGLRGVLVPEDSGFGTLNLQAEDLVGRRVRCSRHRKPTKVEKIAAGVVFLACGCHLSPDDRT